MNRIATLIFLLKGYLTGVSILSLLLIVSTPVLSEFFGGKTASVKIHKPTAPSKKSLPIQALLTRGEPRANAPMRLNESPHGNVFREEAHALSGEMVGID